MLTLAHPMLKKLLMPVLLAPALLLVTPDKARA